MQDLLVYYPAYHILR